MSAELIAESRQQAETKWVFLSRNKTLEKRKRDHGRGDPAFDRLLNSPAAFARILDIS